MGFTLDQVVPWGRSFDEYVEMFDLSSAEMGLRILGCGDGPAAFNGELTRRGGTVVSCDPLYMFRSEQIEQRIAATVETVLAQMERNQADYLWDRIGSVEALGRLRVEAMQAFLADYAIGRGEGRYLAAALPDLPLVDRSFALALSSHFLFLYSEHFSLAFHRQAIAEMLRVADEVRIFPLLTLDGRCSSYLNEIIDYFSMQGYVVHQRRVGYEFQRGGNSMLQIQRAAGWGVEVGL